MPSSSDSLRQLTDVRQKLAAIEEQLSAELLASEQLRRELALRNLALDVGSSHFMIIDARTPERRMVYVNRPLARAHDYEPEDLIGRSVSVLLAPGALDQTTVLEMDAAFAAGRPFRAEALAIRRNGTTFWVGFTNIALRDERGEISHIVSAAADITARLDAERKRRELQEQLVNELRERERMAIELRLAQKLESVGRLAAGLAHEINTPIQYVSDSVHFLRASFDDLMRLLDACRGLLTQHAALIGPGTLASIAVLEQQIDFDFLRTEFPRAFERTLEGTDRVAALVRSMKEFAHPDANEHSAADLNHALETTLMVSRNEYKYLAQVTTDFGDVPVVICNIGELNQVFLNLIVNAAHAIQDSGKNAAEGCIRVATRLVNQSVEVSIADNGCGIDAENLDRIFDPFFTTKAIGRGTGQGLSIARTIVIEKHKGRIQVESQPGVGTTFTIVLPLSESLVEAA
jgi:PAS domain S-box-containing protein